MVAVCKVLPLLSCIPFVFAAPTNTTHSSADLAARASSCFPAVGFSMPRSVPATTSGWWCDRWSEYAFMGFSYEVSHCQSLPQLKSEFSNIRKKFHGRYVRIYGACDRNGHWNDIVEAAWTANIGVHALIWFGFEGGNAWKTRRSNLVNVIRNNPKAKFVIAAIQFGSEPLFDSVLNPYDLAGQIRSLKSQLAWARIPVTISELAYGFQSKQDDGSMSVLDAIDVIDVHTLPFFSYKASTAWNSWSIVTGDINWFKSKGKGKKIYLSQNGWPSVTYDGVQPNSPNAVANVKNEKDYFDLLDSKCSWFKDQSIGWFAHIYSDDQEPGYGIYGNDGDLKFPFNPRRSC